MALLTEQQIAAIIRSQNYLKKVANGIADMNTLLKVEHGLDVRTISITQFEVGRMMYDLDELLFNHDLATDKLRAKSGAHRV